MKLLIATGNAHKLEEFRRILEPLGIEVVSLREVGAVLDVEETGETFAENARMKAKSLWEKTGLGVVADDSGLCIDALGGRPGIQSARYLGEDTPHAEKIKGILAELRDVPAEWRTARFVAAIRCILTDGTEIACQGVCEGSIAFAPSGDGGFGYDPIFQVADRQVGSVEGKSFGELSPEEKDRLSHRGRALRQLAEKLGEYCGNPK